MKSKIRIKIKISYFTRCQNSSILYFLKWFSQVLRVKSNVDILKHQKRFPVSYLYYPVTNVQPVKANRRQLTYRVSQNIVNQFQYKYLLYILRHPVAISATTQQLSQHQYWRRCRQLVQEVSHWEMSQFKNYQHQHYSQKNQPYTYQNMRLRFRK